MRIRLTDMTGNALFILHEAVQMISLHAPAGNDGSGAVSSLLIGGHTVHVRGTPEEVLDGINQAAKEAPAGEDEPAEDEPVLPRGTRARRSD